MARHLVGAARRPRAAAQDRLLAHEVANILVAQLRKKRPQPVAVVRVEGFVRVQPEDPLFPSLVQALVAGRGKAFCPGEVEDAAPKSAAMALVRSVEPVSTTTTSSHRSAAEARQVARLASSFFTIMHSETGAGRHDDGGGQLRPGRVVRSARLQRREFRTKIREFRAWPSTICRSAAWYGGRQGVP